MENRVAITAIHYQLTMELIKQRVIVGGRPRRGLKKFEEKILDANDSLAEYISNGVERELDVDLMNLTSDTFNRNLYAKKHPVSLIIEMIHQHVPIHTETMEYLIKMMNRDITPHERQTRIDEAMVMFKQLGEL